MARFLFLTLFCFLTFLSKSNAAHIIGGDVTYKCLSSDPNAQSNRYEITFTMYRDAGGTGAPFDNPARFGIFERATNASEWVFISLVSDITENRDFVSYEDNCVVLPPNLLVEKGVYRFEIVLPWADKVYQIAYQRCCRNGSISNISNPGETGAVFSLEIPGQPLNQCNNSPLFKNFPPIIICVNKPLNFDHSAIDSDGDSLAYEFCAPLTSGGTDGATTPGDPNSCTGVTPSPSLCLPPYAEVQFLGQYSGNNPLGGIPQVKIDNHTGLITGTPNSVGQYVVGVCVKEYRNHELIGSIRRDFQFNVLVCEGITDTLRYSICAGDSVKVNDQSYFDAGTYTQQFQTNQGCDSTLYIIIKKFNTSVGGISYNICEGTSVTVNGETFSVAGDFTQTLTNANGCDSTLFVNITLLPKSEGTLNIQLCSENESALVNGTTYNTIGSYTQTLKNRLGCDSTLHINITQGVATSAVINYSLCNESSFTVNNETYATAGQYVQILTSSTGCDSTLTINILPCEASIYYDLEKCSAVNPVTSMNYDEFTPKSVNTPPCSQLVTSNLLREDPQSNKHSCSQGHDSDLSMCVGASTACDVNAADANPIVISFTVAPEENSNLRFNNLIFYQKAPLIYNWIGGNSGSNNYPTKYAIRVLKDGVEIYKKENVPATNEWQKEQYDFFDADVFTVAEQASFRIEILPYCQVGNGSPVSVWDIDDVSIYLSCETKTNRIIGGSIVSTGAQMPNAKIKRIDNFKVHSSSIANNGTYMLMENDPLATYKLQVYCNDSLNYGVSTYDLVLIQRHILGLQKFTNAYQFLAADVNRDHKINVNDLVELRKIIIGTANGFNRNNSWLYLNESQCIPFANPWEIEDFIIVTPSYKDLYDVKFRAIKIGDVSGASNTGNN